MTEKIPETPPTPTPKSPTPEKVLPAKVVDPLFRDIPYREPTPQELFDRRERKRRRQQHGITR